MDNAPVFEPAIYHHQEKQQNDSFWDLAKQAYKEKRPKEVITNILKYLDPSLVEKYGNEDQTHYSIPHGSITLDITISQNHLEINAPFLNVPEKKATILYRQVATINFSVLMLSQIVLKDNRLDFHFKTALELLDPNKIFSVLSEICINADHYDDIFIDELGANRIKDMNVKSYTNDELINLWKKYKTYLTELETYTQHFENKRLLVNAIEIIQALIYRLRYYMEPQGVLAADIENIIQLCKQNLAENQKLEQLNSSIKKLQAYTEEKFISCMYIPTFLIQPKRSVSLHFVQDYFGKYLNQSKKWLDQGQYVDVVTGQMIDTYSILDEYQPPLSLEKKLIQALSAASGQPWKKAAQLLYDVADEILALEELPASYDNPLELAGQMMSDKLNKFFGLWK